MNYEATTPDKLTRHRNSVAARLSAIPGLGQLYKGHYLEACAVILLALTVAAWVGTLFCLTYAAGAFFAIFDIPIDWVKVLVNPVTVCMGVLPALLFWAWAVIDAYQEPDLRHRLPIYRPPGNIAAPFASVTEPFSLDNRNPIARLH